jgi:TIR domain
MPKQLGNHFHGNVSPSLSVSLRARTCRATSLSATSVRKTYLVRVSDFRIHLENELRGTTGKRELVVFQDKDKLGAGDVYPEVLAENVRAAKVLIILLSPGWLAGSRWCIHEYNIFKKSMALCSKKLSHLSFGMTLTT